MPLEIFNRSNICPDCERKNFTKKDNDFWIEPQVQNYEDERREAMEECEQSELVRLLKDYDEAHPLPARPVWGYIDDGWGNDRWYAPAGDPLDQLLNIRPPLDTKVIDGIMWNYLHVMDAEVTANKAKEAIEKIKEDSDG